jgi:micrococcal nuclease
MIAVLCCSCSVHVYNHGDTAAAVDDDLQVALVRVIDGDTVDVIWRGKVERIRLRAIDAPERGREGFQEAGDVLRDLLAGKRLRLEWEHGAEQRDSYGRAVAYLWAGDTNVCVALVRRGLARYWPYKTPSKYAGQFAPMQ